MGRHCPGTRRIKPVPVADGDLEYSLPFCWPPGLASDRRRRGYHWGLWQESSYVDTLNFVWFHLLGLGKRDDLVHAFVTAYQNTSDVRGVVIDIPMSSELNGIDSRISIWQTAEMLKNRSVTSNKYASATFFLPRLHVVIMTNQPVPIGAFGANRLRIHNLEQSSLGVVR